MRLLAAATRTCLCTVSMHVLALQSNAKHTKLLNNAGWGINSTFCGKRSHLLVITVLFSCLFSSFVSLNLSPKYSFCWPLQKKLMVVTRFLQLLPFAGLFFSRDWRWSEVFFSSSHLLPSSSPGTDDGQRFSSAPPICCPLLLQGLMMVRGFLQLLPFAALFFSRDSRWSEVFFSSSHLLPSSPGTDGGYRFSKWLLCFSETSIFPWLMTNRLFFEYSYFVSSSPRPSSSSFLFKITTYNYQDYSIYHQVTPKQEPN